MTPYQANVDLNDREFQEGKIVLNSWPRQLGVVVTTRCNLHCIMCTRPTENNVLPYAAFQKLAFLYPYLDSLNWQGGEAFLADYFEEAVLLAAEYPQLQQEMNTAGVLITKRWADVLARARMKISFSIDGVTKPTYEYIRRGSQFETLLGALGHIKNARAQHGRSLEMILSVVVMRSNHRELPQFLEFAREHGFRTIYLNPVRFVKDQENIFFHKDKQALDYLNDVIPQCEIKAGEYGIDFTSFLPKYQPEKAAAPSVAAISSPVNPGETFLKSSPPPPRPMCRRPWKKLFVDVGRHHGAVYPECFCPTPAGYLPTDSLADIWNGFVMRTYRARLLAGTMEGFCNSECTSGRVDQRWLSE